MFFSFMMHCSVFASFLIFLYLTLVTKWETCLQSEPLPQVLYLESWRVVLPSLNELENTYSEPEWNILSPRIYLAIYNQ